MLTHLTPYNLSRYLVGTDSMSYYHPHLRMSNRRHRTIRHLAQGHTASRGWRCKHMAYKTNLGIKSEAATKGRWCYGVRGWSQRALTAKEGKLWKPERGYNLRSGAQTCSWSRLLGTGVGEGRGCEGLERIKTRGRETHEEIPQSHSPSSPTKGAPPRRSSLPCFSWVPGFSSAVTMCHLA